MRALWAPISELSEFLSQTVVWDFGHTYRAVISLGGVAHYGNEYQLSLLTGAQAEELKVCVFKPG